MFFKLKSSKQEFTLFLFFVDVLLAIFLHAKKESSIKSNITNFVQKFFTLNGQQITEHDICLICLILTSILADFLVSTIFPVESIYDMHMETECVSIIHIYFIITIGNPNHFPFFILFSRVHKTFTRTSC